MLGTKRTVPFMAKPHDKDVTLLVFKRCRCCKVSPILVCEIGECMQERPKHPGLRIAVACGIFMFGDHIVGTMMFATQHSNEEHSDIKTSPKRGTFDKRCRVNLLF